MMLSINGCIKSVKIYKNLEKLYNKKSWMFILFLCILQRRHKALRFEGKGKGAVVL